MTRVLLLAAFLFILPAAITGQENGKKRYRATRITTAPAINGILDDEAWKEGIWADDFVQFEPYNGREPSQRTAFMILFDDDNLYVAIKAYDSSPDSIVNRLTRRDMPDGDLAGVIFDSFYDLRTGFLFGVSSSGVKYDQMFLNDGQNQDSSWDPNWWVKTSINDEGWVAEMKIPFSQLRFEKNSGNIWGLEVARSVYRNNETVFWQHIPKDAPGLVHMFGEMEGLEQIKPRKIFDVTPYAVARAETFRAIPENPFLASGKLGRINGGIDAKIGVTNNMTLDLTINPDFGQVEADPSVVNLSAYETFFSERRPFFIEGKNITNFNLGIGDGEVGNDNLFYSRRIGRKPQGYPTLQNGSFADIPTSTTILGAAKLTGKTKNGLSLGFIEALTAEEKAEVSTDGERSFQTVEPLTNYFVGRVQKDYNEGKTILGGILTSTNRDLDDNLGTMLHRSAYTGGIDFTQYFREKSWMLSLSSALSHVAGSREALQITQKSSARYYQRPDNDYVTFDPNRTSLTGSGGRLQVMKLNGHFNLMGVVTWKTPGFETNDMGYIREADQILSVFWVGYNQWEPKWIYRRYNINMDVYSVWNFGGDYVTKGYEYNASMTLKNFWNIFGGGNISSSSLSTGMLRGGPMMKVPGNNNMRIGFSTDSRKKLGFQVFANSSQGFQDYSSSVNTGITISYKPTNYLSLSFNPGYSKSFSELQYVTRLNFNDESRYIFASIDRKTINTSFRVNLNLSPDLTLQYWGQPFVATGSYYDHKYITDPMADRYGDRFHVYGGSEITLSGDDYLIDENADGTTDYSFGKRDFNVQEFLSNLVVRWEYSPGSSVFLVWSQTRSGFNNTGNLKYFDDIGNLFDASENKPRNIFLIKFSYRFGLK